MKRDEYLENVVDWGDRISQLAKDVSVASYGNCPALYVVGDKGPGWRSGAGYLWVHEIYRMLGNYTTRGNEVDEWEMKEEVENDGAGTKPGLMALLGTADVWAWLASELIAMCADDLARKGKFAAAMINQVDFKSVTKANFHLADSYFIAYGEALRKAHLVNLTGETAIMGSAITAFCDTGDSNQLICTLSGACLGLAHRDLLVTGQDIKSGMPIVGTIEPGPRCNGYSKLINILSNVFGVRAQDLLIHSDSCDFALEAATPSHIYAPTLNRICGWNADGTPGEKRARISGIAHITGGGINKFREILPDGVGAHLSDLPDPSWVLRRAQVLAEGTPYAFDDRTGYEIFNGGLGMVIPTDDPDEVIAELEQDDIDALVIGETVVSDDRTVTLESCFLNGGTLSWPPA